MGKYDDIIDLPHHQSAKRAHMPQIDRAAQFSPFAALTGYDASLAESVRLTDAKAVLSDDQITALNGILQQLRNEKLQPPVRITYFVPDDRKEGGEYRMIEGIIRRINDEERTIILTDGFRLFMDDILSIDLSDTE